MAEWCNILLVLLSQLALWVNTAWSWLLDNWAALRAWWEPRERAVKILVLAGVTVILGAGAWALGQYVFTCAEWPALVTAALMIVSAIAGLFAGGKRHEAEKADRYQAEALELRQKVQALQFELEQLRRRP